jgi:hypothetical protein
MRCRKGKHIAQLYRGEVRVSLQWFELKISKDITGIARGKKKRTRIRFASAYQVEEQGENQHGGLLIGVATNLNRPIRSRIRSLCRTVCVRIEVSVRAVLMVSLWRATSIYD